MKRLISIVGAGQCSFEVACEAHQLGRLLALEGFNIICGGLGGVMENVCKGAREAGGETIGILPGNDIKDANQYITYPLATGLGQMRNYIIVLNGILTIAISGGYGTLSEIALAKKSAKKVIVLGGWSIIPGILPAEDSEHVIRLVQGLV